jgi:putative chitinase
MTLGLFTGKKLSHYFNDNIDDPVGARRIVNGTDKAKLIALYHKNFLDAIKASKDVLKLDEIPRNEKPEEPDDVPVTKSPEVLGGLATAATTGAFGAFQNIDNPFALAAFVILGVVVAVGAYSFFSGKFTINRRS